MQFGRCATLRLCLVIFFLGGDAIAEDSIPSSEKVAAFGMHEVRGKHLRLITDLPLDDEIRSLPKVFDAAIPQWQSYFGKEIDNLSEWKAVAALIGDRQKFVDIGMLTKNIPNFKEGYQAGGRLFVMEQPSPYYRRHLLLHEGTHWFMANLFGGNGPTWYMEGMADLLATHAWDGSRVELAIMPKRSEDVPYWGRVKVIKEQLQLKQAPSLDAIMKIQGSARMEVEAYAWSWAACLFFTHHPQGKEVLRAIASKKLDYSDQLNKDLVEQLKADWPRIKATWEGFASELDYGYDLDRAFPAPNRQSKPMSDKQTKIEIDAGLGWQSTGVIVQRGQKIHLQSSGRYRVFREEGDWLAEPNGITLRYVDDHPLGMLLATVVAPPRPGELVTRKWKVVPIGRDATFECEEAGELLLKINDRPSELADNDGRCQVVIGQ
ncbi:MAG: hypothetical protein U0905_13250 [Pirellulales bacterium]